jgi:hypothetical protein
METKYKLIDGMRKRILTEGVDATIDDDVDSTIAIEVCLEIERGIIGDILEQIRERIIE